jgi:uncharacterized alpha-E superfamily protein
MLKYIRTTPGKDVSLSDELIRTTQVLNNLERALERFMESSAAVRQRLSDATWSELVSFKEQHPEVTIDDIIEVHEEFLRSFDSKAAQMTGLQGQIKQAHRGLIDSALDAHNEQRKNK